MTATQRARTSDPWTSHESAQHSAEFAGRHQQVILSVMFRERKPLAAEELNNLIGFPPHVSVHRRLSELKAKGLIEPDEGNYYVNQSGCRARRYRLKVQP